MPRVYHSQANNIANHSLYQTELLGSQHSTLKEIAANTKNINLNVDTLEVNTDTLETKIAETNTKLAAQKTVLDAMLIDTDAIDSSCNTIEAQSVLTASRLNNIQNKIAANVDGSGDTLGQINSNILTKNGEIESSLNSLISANHSDLIALEASLTSMEGKQDSIKTAVELLDNCVSGTELQVDIVSSALPSGAATQTTLASILAKNTEIETTNNACQVLLGTIDSDTNAIKDALEGTLTVGSHAVSNNGTFAVQSTIAASLPAGDNNIGNVDIVSSALPTGAATQTTLASILSKNTEIETTNNACQVLLGTIDSDTNAIKDALEGTLTVGSHAVSNNGTFAVQSTVAAALPAGTNRVGMVGMKANEAVDGSGTERFVLCDAAGHLQVDVLSGGGSTDVSGLSTHAKQDTIIGHLDGVEGKLDTIETTNNACQVLLGTIDSDTNAIKDALEGTLTVGSHAVSNNGTFAVQSTIAAALPAGDNNIGNVDIVSSALPSGAATQTTLASILAKNTEIETTNNANQVLLGTIDSDTDNIKTATEAIENAVHVDDAAYTLGTHSVMMMGGFAGTQAVGANDAGALAMTTTGFLKIVNPMTTTQIDDGKSVSAGASTTSSVLNVSHVPTGRITFVMDPAVISVGDIQIDSVQYSFDGTLYLQLYTENVSTRDATGHKLIQIKDFFAPHFRIHFTNQSGGSNETNLDIWAVY